MQSSYSFPRIGFFSLSHLCKIAYCTSHIQREFSTKVLYLSAFDENSQPLISVQLHMYTPQDEREIMEQALAFEKTVRDIIEFRSKSLYHFPKIGTYSRSFISQIYHILGPFSDNSYMMYLHSVDGSKRAKEQGLPRLTQEEFDAFLREIDLIQQTSPNPQQPRTSTPIKDQKDQKEEREEEQKQRNPFGAYA